MDIELLMNRVYKTRKARINTSERLKSAESFIQGINVYYSCVLMALSIVGLNYQSYIFALLSTIASITLAMSLLYLTTQRYSERAQELKNNYIDLQQLYFELEHFNDNEPKTISELEKKYITLLHSSENHSGFDYLKALISIDSKSVSCKDKCKYYSSLAFKFLIRFSCIALPIVVGIVVYIINK